MIGWKRALLSTTNKDVLPALLKSNKIYRFSYHCDSWYVGCTTQRLQDRIKQPFPKSIHSYSFQKRILPAHLCKSSNQPNTQSLAIKLHLLQNFACTQDYGDSRFFILAHCCSPFHLSALEATFIKTFNLLPKKIVCVQLKIVH